MNKAQSNDPPPYSEVIQSPMAQFPITGGISEHMQSVPSGYNAGPTFPNQYYPNGSGYIPPPPPPGMAHQVPQTHFMPSAPTYGAINTTITTVPSEIIIIGGCPVCRIGVLEDDYPMLGVCCAIFFFPLGILCCLAMKNKRCSNCNAEF